MLAYEKPLTGVVWRTLDLEKAKQYQKEDIVREWLEHLPQELSKLKNGATWLVKARRDAALGVIEEE